MKRSQIVVPALALLAICAVAAGQGVSKAAYKGGFVVSGQAGASLNFRTVGETDAQETSMSLNMSPRALYFLIDGLGAGLEGGLSYSSSTGYKSTGLSIGPRIAYYIVQTEKKYPRACCMTPYVGEGWWMPYVGLSLLYLSNSYDYQSYVSKSNGWLVRIGAGLSPLIGDRGTMPIEVGYEMQSLKGVTDSDHSSSRIYLEVGFGAFLFKD